MLDTNYIVLDLEWTGHPDGKPHPEAALPLEIIEIGAVKLDASLQIVDTFHTLIRPQVYHDLHPHAKRLLHLTMRDLAHAPTFPKASDAFFSWCGKGYRFCTWGAMDLTELQRNLTYYEMDHIFPKPLLYYDLQQIFSLQQGESRTHTLAYAVEELSIPRELPYHRALADAWYTAQVMQRLDLTLIHKNYSIDYYRHPHSRSEEITLSYENSLQFISREYPTRNAALHASSVTSLVCPVCGKKAARLLQWFSPTSKNYYALGRCKKHGYVQGKLHIKYTDEKQCFVIKHINLVSEEEAKQLQARFQSMQEKRQMRQKRKGPPQARPKKRWGRKKKNKTIKNNSTAG